MATKNLTFKNVTATLPKIKIVKKKAGATDDRHEKKQKESLPETKRD